MFSIKIRTVHEIEFNMLIQLVMPCVLELKNKLYKVIQGH